MYQECAQCVFSLLAGGVSCSISEKALELLYFTKVVWDQKIGKRGLAAHYSIHYGLTVSTSHLSRSRSKEEK